MRQTRSATALLLLITLAAVVAGGRGLGAQGPVPTGALQRLLDAELSRIPAKAGIWVKHLKTGEQAAVRGDERFNSASVIKIPVMVMAYQMAEAGRLDLQARVPIGKADRRGGSGVLRYHDL
ncbi:MAG: serine hydrolase, partial [Acidobacteria bacterium]|nr:serine hydrolase [Acidobacteriota bacterium]